MINKKALSTSIKYENIKLNQIKLEAVKLNKEKVILEKKHNNLSETSDQLMSVYRDSLNKEIFNDAISLKEKSRWANNALNLKLSNDNQARKINLKLDNLKKEIIDKKSNLRGIESIQEKKESLLKEIKIKDIFIKSNLLFEDIIEAKYNG